MKQTAVSWLKEQLYTINKTQVEWHKLFEQAKEMEKQQIVDANYSGKSEGGVSPHEADEYMQSAQDYYSQTYSQ